MSQNSTLLQQFEAFEISAPDFHHEDHIRVAFQMLDSYEFVEACSRYANTIEAMADGVGAPEKFNVTITFAFMSLVAERKANFNGEDLEGFLSANPDLLRRSVLRGWYSDERLASPDARSHFLLPDKMGGIAA